MATDTKDKSRKDEEVEDQAEETEDQAAEETEDQVEETEDQETEDQSEDEDVEAEDEEEDVEAEDDTEDAEAEDEEEDVEAEDDTEDAEAEDEEEDVEAEDDTEDAEAEDEEEDVEAEDESEDAEDETEDAEDETEDAEAEDEDEADEDEDEDKTALLHLDIQPFDLDLLGLEISSDGLNLELNAIPGDGNLLGNVLNKATELLGKLTGGGGDGESGSLSAGGIKGSVVERANQIKDWIVEKVQFLIRFVLGKLAHMAADRLAQPSKGGGSKDQKSKKGTSKKAA